MHESEVIRTAHTNLGWPKGKGRLVTFARENGLSIVMLLLFAASIVGHAISGHHAANEEAREHGARAIGFAEYLVGGDFVESVFENWESEFLQMAVFVVLTKFLRQKGSSESKALGKDEDVDEDPNGKRNDQNAPWPVRQGGVVLAIYQRSLSLALIALFVGSFALHAVGGASQYNEDQRRHGGKPVSILEYTGSSRFWFESFQNWQSEFLSVAVLVLLSIVFREQGSSQSKPVAAPNDQTGG